MPKRTDIKKILVIHGPNLNLLGEREPGVYGSAGIDVLNENIIDRAKEQGLQCEIFQSNHEGDLIDQIQEFKGDGIVLNAGGYSHTSVALRDAVEESEVPVVEVHISDITKREPFRQTSLLTPVCAYNIIGKGTKGYEEAVEYILAISC